MVNPGLFQLAGFTGFCAYPKDHPPVTVVVPDYHKVFVKEFVWETLLNDNMTCDEMIVNEDYEPLCICDICNDTFEICGEFITHLKSEEHIKEVSILRKAFLMCIIITFVFVVKYTCELCLFLCSCLIWCPEAPTVSLNIFAKFAIIPPTTAITCSSITKVKNIIAR